MYAHWFQAYICVLVDCACILHNWQGLLCITHKSIENSTAFFCTLLFSLSLCWCVFFSFIIVRLLCAVVRAGATVTETRAALFGWRKFLEVYVCMGCTCVSVCLRQCVVASVCVCVCECLNRVVVGDVAPAVRERDEGQRVSCLASKRNEINSK